MSELPWNHMSEEMYDIRRAQLQLDKDHYGLDKVRCMKRNTDHKGCKFCTHRLLC